jgi:prepilin-type N-terminal cleavage/methylation domain-containing protein
MSDRIESFNEGGATVQTGNDYKNGFTMVEICLAVLIIGIGLLSVFSLFPAGLKLAEESALDTRSGLFADTILGGIRGNAAGITNWSDWDGVSVNELINGVFPGLKAGETNSIEFPENSAAKESEEDWLRYYLSVNIADEDRFIVTLDVEDGRYPLNKLGRNPSRYYTEVFYTGR